MEAMMICKYCNELFDEIKPWQVFCCQRCQQDWHLQQRKVRNREQRAAADASLAEKVREALANIEIDIPANATREKHKCQGCNRYTTNERFCSARCRGKFFDRYQDAPVEEPGRKSGFVRRI